jgi:glycosyltransferase involved in cell wall biosynthesis
MTPSSGKQILMTTDAVGGVWTYASTLAEGLAERGWRVRLVTIGPAPSERQLAPLLRHPSITTEITDLALEWQDPEGADHRRALRRLEALERDFRPDIVHLNGFREALADWRAPVLVAAHSCVLSWWQACKAGEPCDGKWLHYGAQVKASLNAADRWVAPTSAFREQINVLYSPATPGEVIHNGMRQAAEQSTVKEPLILAAGRLWDEAKNIGILSRIAASVRWPISIAGSLHERGGAPTSARLGDHIEWLGELPHQDLLQIMGRAEIFVAPALYEPFGLGVLEAAMNGCALVVSDIPTFRELWDGATLFVDPRDPDQLQHALNRLIADPDLRRSLRSAARLRAQHLTIDIQASAYDRLYKQMIASFAERRRTRQPSLRAVA